MQDLTLYSFNEMIALVFSVLIGTGAYLSYLIVKKNQKFSIGNVILILFMNAFITNLISEILRRYNFGEYRSILLPLAAFGGQYFMDWIDKRYLKIFDAASKKAGLDLNKDSIIDDEENNTENIINNE